MKNLVPRFVMGVLLMASVPAHAGVLDVTNSSQVSVATSDSLVFYVSPPSAVAAQGQIEIEIVLGTLPLAGATQPIPGTSAVYVTGALFSGSIESPDGSFSIPLYDPNAARLDLPAGDLLLTPGWRGGGSYSGPIDLLSAEAILTVQQAARLFGSGDALVDLHNLGGGVTFGYPGALITNDFSASLISDGGTQSQGARVMGVETVNAPEPGTIGLALLAAALIAGRALKVGLRHT